MVNKTHEQLYSLTHQIAAGPHRADPMRWLALIGLLLFLVAPGFPALKLTNEGTYSGLTLLLLGWIGVIGVSGGDMNAIGWMANPLFAVGTIAVFLKARKTAFCCLLASALFAIFSFCLREVPRDEAGNMDRVQGYLIGFWLWQSAIWFNLLLAIFLIMRQQIKSGSMRLEARSPNAN